MQLNSLVALLVTLFSFCQTSQADEVICNEENKNGIPCKTQLNLGDERLKISTIQESFDQFSLNIEPWRAKITTRTCSGAPVDFACSKEGRFPDWSDSTCMWYFECEKLRDGNYLAKYLRCPSSLFDPAISKCTTSYVCPCSYNTSTTTEPAVTSQPSWCTASDTEDFVCTTVGRFPDFKDITCQSYFLCSKLHNGTYLKTEYGCKESAFDPNIGRCNKTYTCPCNTGASTSASSTLGSSSISTTVSSISTDDGVCTPPSIEDFEFDCSDVGRFPDLSDPECQKYFLCSKLHNGSYIKTPYACPNVGFDPHIGKCNISYTCPCSTVSVTLPFTTSSIGSSIASTSSSVLSSEPTVTVSTPYPCLPITEDEDNFVCTTVGRFPDLTDQKCQKYFLCSKLRNGTFIRTDYSCPGSKFDPRIGKCNSTYECPCAAQTASATQAVSTASSLKTSTVDPADDSSSDEDSSSSDSSSVEETTRRTSSTASQSSSVSVPQSTPFPCLPPLPDESEHSCDQVGRFPDLRDQKCQKYFLCSKLRNGTFIRTDYACPDSKFDPYLGKCNIKYSCPCLVISK